MLKLKKNNYKKIFNQFLTNFFEYKDIKILQNF